MSAGSCIFIGWTIYIAFLAVVGMILSWLFDISCEAVFIGTGVFYCYFMLRKIVRIPFIVPITGIVFWGVLIFEGVGTLLTMFLLVFLSSLHRVPTDIAATLLEATNEHLQF